MRTTSLVFPLRFLFFMWVVFSIEFFLRVDLGYLGIYPRDFSGLIGVVIAPLLHGSIAHILSNRVPLLVLGGIHIDKIRIKNKKAVQKANISPQAKKQLASI